MSKLTLLLFIEQIKTIALPVLSQWVSNGFFNTLSTVIVIYVAVFCSDFACQITFSDESVVALQGDWCSDVFVVSFSYKWQT